MPLADPATAVLPAAQQHLPGLWLVSAPLVKACELAAVLSPQALAVADDSAWVASRRTSFLAGRAVAATGLSALGCAGVVGREANGAPHWPPGCVGSIAHDAAWAVALVGHSAQWAAVGVDVEPDEPLPPDAAGLVLLPQDQAGLIHTFGAAAQAHSRLVFSAKECVHKALHPWRGAWLEFDEVRIECQAQGRDAGRWQARPVSAAATQAFHGVVLDGEWWRADGALWTLLALRR